MTHPARKSEPLKRELEQTVELLDNSTLKSSGLFGAGNYRIPILTFLSGDALGKEIPLLQQQIIFGRGDEADVLVLDPSVSRKHIKLTCRKLINHGAAQDIKVVLLDLGSKNGSMVNYRKVKRAVLQPGDKIIMGSVILKFEMRDLAEQTFFDEIFRMATTDGLTGLLNKASITRALREEKAKQRRYKRKYSVIVVDLDNFKKLNDTLGHVSGDLVLKAAANAIRRNLREQDKAGRFGGEEFLILLPETGRKGAGAVAERIRADIEGKTSREAGVEGAVVTASFGVASAYGREKISEEIVRWADSALYEAKKKGKNRVEHWRGSGEPAQD
jgi:two-component system, cell cycle response regulator